MKSRTSGILLGVVILLLAAGLAPRAAAGEMLFHTNSTYSLGGTRNLSGCTGTRFTPSTNVTITALGYEDIGGDGLTNAHRVGIWRTSDNGLLGWVTVPAGTGATLQEAWRFVNLSTGIILRAGVQYIVGGEDVSPDKWTDGNLGYSADRFALSAGFSGPSGYYGGTGWPNQPGSSLGGTSLRSAPGNAIFTNNVLGTFVDVTAVDSVNRIIGGGYADTHYSDLFSCVGSGPQRTLVKTVNATLLTALQNALGGGGSGSDYIIDSAVLRVVGFTPSGTVTGRRLLVTWDSSEVTWNKRDVTPSVAWATGGLLAGTDYNSATDATAVLVGGETTFDFTSVVQAWLAGSVANNGVFFPESAGNSTAAGNVSWVLRARINTAGVPPSLTNAAVTGVTTNGATFNGTLTLTGTATCAVGVLWGGDTNAWGSTNWFNGGAVNPAYTNGTAFSTNIALSANQTYYYTYVASNASGTTVAGNPVALITGEVTVEATDNSAKYPADNGIFTISRPPALTNAALVVNYTMGGTAVSNVDYTALSGSVTLNPGVSNTTLTVTPLRLPGVPSTAILTLAPGAYATGALNTATVTIQPSGPLYVTPTGTGGGANWADATSLTNALRICMADQSIWLEQGTYSNATTFTVATNGVVLYGGFTNGMATLGERNWTNYPTILDGNAQTLRVVTVTASGARLDGLTLRNARHTATAGGGITKQNAGSLTLANCRIVDHYGTAAYQNGLGAYFTAGSILMTNCLVANNTRDIFNSAGMGVYASGANLDLVDCLFTNQYGSYWDTRSEKGAALYFDNGRLTGTRTDFLNNNAGTDNGGGGGAVYLGSTAGTAASFTNCVFRGNVIPWQSGVLGPGNGAAVWANLNSASTARFVNCTFAYNTAVYGSGGALYLSAGTLEVKNCLMWSNSIAGTGQYGIDIYQAGGTLQVNYCGLAGSGAPYVYSAGGTLSVSSVMTNDPLFVSSTDLHVKSPAGRWDPAVGGFVTTDTAYSPAIDAGDPADPVGAEVAPNGGRINLGAYGGTAQASKSPTIVAPQVANFPPLTNDYTRMILRGEVTNNATASSVYICYGTNSVAGETTNGWGTVSLISPAPATGVVFTLLTPYLLTNTTYYYRCFATNAAGGSWAPVESFVTAESYPPFYGVGGGSNVIHVRAGATGVADGSDWHNAFTTILAGIGAIAGTRTNLWITGGTYTEGLQLTLGSSATIVGGFAGGETSVAQRALTNAAGVVTNYTGINGANSYGCLSMTASSVTLDTLSFSNASAGASALYKNNAGTVVLNNCRAERNNLRGVELNNCTVQMTGCQLRENIGGGHGIGGYFSSSTVTMTNCVVQANTNNGVNCDGNGIYANGCTLTLLDCRIQDQYGHPFNNRCGYGSGLAAYGGTLRVLRTDFIGNRNTGHDAFGRQGGGAALFVGDAINASFSNCVFRGNQVMDPLDTPAVLDHHGYGGGIQARMTAAGTASFVNCTFGYNSNSCTLGAGGMLYSQGGTVAFKNCILWGNGTVQAGDVGTEIYATNVNSCVVTGSYTCITGTNLPQVVTGGATVAWGGGILVGDPFLAGVTDAHLKSKGGRWDPGSGTWVRDGEHSPCIDTGDPTDPVGGETQPNGGKINMGAYGGTSQASLSMYVGTSFKFR